MLTNIMSSRIDPFIIILMSLTFSLALFAQSSAQKEWDKLSQDEKWLCLLSEPYLYDENLNMTTLNPEPQGGEIIKKWLENDWNLHSKNDVLNLVEANKKGTWGGKNWELEKAKDLFERYPDSSIDEIVKTEYLRIDQAAILCFYKENKDKYDRDLGSM